MNYRNLRKIISKVTEIQCFYSLKILHPYPQVQRLQIDLRWGSRCVHLLHFKELKRFLVIDLVCQRCHECQSRKTLEYYSLRISSKDRRLELVKEGFASLLKHR